MGRLKSRLKKIEMVKRCSKESQQISTVLLQNRESEKEAISRMGLTELSEKNIVFIELVKAKDGRPAP